MATITPASLLLVLFAALSPQQTGRSSALALEFSKGAKTYDIPEARGLKTFHCDATFDWKAFLSDSKGSTVPDDDPGLVYLQGTQLAIDDDLRGGADLRWSNTGVAPSGRAESAASIRRGLEQLVPGFFSTWNGFANGEMVTLTDDKTAVEHKGTGYRLSASDKSGLVEEEYDASFLLQRFHMASVAQDIVMSPEFRESADGRVLSKLVMSVRVPATADAKDVVYTIGYLKVGSYQLPSTLKILVPGAPRFNFTFSNCSVQTKMAAGKP